MRLSMGKVLGFMAGTIAFIMAILDTTIVNIVLPDMMNDLHASVSTISWVLNAYNMAFAVLLISAARLADQFGRKKIFMAGIVLFTLFSLLCGLAPDVNRLILFRTLQGVGAAILVPVSIPVLLSLFRKEQQPLIIAIWGACSALASACGPVIGGLLVHYGSWHDVFYVNIPLGLAALILTLFFVRETYDPDAGRRIDWLGMITLSAAIASLTFYLIKGNDYGWLNPSMLILPGVCVISLLLFLLGEWKTLAPMLPLALFKSRTFRCSNAIILLIGVVINAVMFVCSLYLTQLRGLSVLNAGYLLSALPIGTMLLSIVCSRLMKKIAPAMLLAAASCIIGVSALFMSRFTTDTPYVSIAIVLAISGCGFGLNLPVVMNLLVNEVPGGRIGMASGLGNMARNLGSIVGVALIVAILTGSLQGSLGSLKDEAVKKINHNTMLLAPVKKAAKSKIKTMRTEASSTGSLSTHNTSLQKKLDRQLQSVYQSEKARLDQNIDRQAAGKREAVVKKIRSQKQYVQQTAALPKRTQLLAMLNKKEQLARQTLLRKREAMKQQADRVLLTKVNQQRHELLHIVDWMQERARDNVAHAFHVAFDTIAGTAFSILLLCPFIRRSRRIRE